MTAKENIENGLAGESLIAAIHSLSHKLMLLYSQIVYNQTGLNWQDWRILRAVVGLQSCRAQDICDECGLKKPHVSNGLARLEKAGHIERSKNRENSKVKVVTSTPQGTDLVERAKPVLDNLNAQFSNSGNTGTGDQLLNELRGYQEELDRLAKSAAEISGTTDSAAKE